MAGIRFLTEVGRSCTDQRQEFILLSDTLGLSMLVDLINHRVREHATESTVLGPVLRRGFTVARQRRCDHRRPRRPTAAGHRSRAGYTGRPLCRCHRRRVAERDQSSVRGAGRRAVTGEPARPVSDGRRRRLRFSNGPTGGLPDSRRRSGRQDARRQLDGIRGGRRTSTSWCPRTGYVPVTTHVFDSESRYLESDVVFGVKQSLVRTFVVHDPDDAAEPAGISGRWYTVDIDIALRPTPAG